MELAQRYGLTIYDLQGDQATRPPDMEPAIRGLIEELRPPDHWPGADLPWGRAAL